VKMDEVMERVRALAEEEIRAQGHVATGRGVNSLEGVVIDGRGERIVGGLFVEEYMIIQDEGVTAARIPYSPGSGRRFSRFIQGLIRWSEVVKPGMADEERLGFAIAVAKTMKKEGMPTRGSYSFSRNGRRTGWIESGVEDQREKIENELALFKILEGEFGAAVDQAMR